jgi:Rieske Fe-S protein
MSQEPLWRSEFPLRTGEERYVTRRQFTRFLLLTSLGMFVGNLWILLRSWWRGETAFPMQAIAQAGDVPVGTAKLFHYPGPDDPCLLIRTAADSFVAYSQKCTHLSCAVFHVPEANRLECPCHEGYFAIADGRVLQGPPPRPLPRVRLERRGDAIVAVGMDLGERG